jgi:hypothetical protein
MTAETLKALLMIALFGVLGAAISIEKIREFVRRTLSGRDRFWIAATTPYDALQRVRVRPKRQPKA